MKVDEITYAINGAIFEVNKILGPGFLEKVYEGALLVELTKKGVRAKRQVPINVGLRGHATMPRCLRRGWMASIAVNVFSESCLFLCGRNAPSPWGGDRSHEASFFYS